jgi:6-phosphogluconolactonase
LSADNAAGPSSSNVELQSLNSSARYDLYVGTYTHRPTNPDWPARGIYLGRFDLATGVLSELELAAPIHTPSFLALDPSQRFLYAVGEHAESPMRGADGLPYGLVSAFARDPETGALTLLNERPSHGLGPCYVSTDRTGAIVLVANYGSGSVVALPVQADGSLGEATVAIQHEGSSAHPTRQTGPHAHSIVVDPGNRFVLAADLGIDQVRVYRLDPAGRRLMPHNPPSIQLASGAGPRHIAFHPSGAYVYVINELGSTVSAFRYDGERGTLTWMQIVATLPEGFTGPSTTADLHVHPSGRFLYGSNRGHDSLAVFAIDPASGRLNALGHVSTEGQTPRGFVVDPSGAFLLVANQRSDTIVVFKIDEASGMPIPTGQVVDAPTPTCLRFAASRRVQSRPADE